ncbi:MAG: DEAD/DEAH box helicase [Planctomycetota bacterium]
MSIITIWSPFFQSDARMKGRSHHLGGRVKPLEPVNDEIVRVEVTDDGQTHTVTISADGRYAIAECTCERFANGAFCDHIWAALLSVQHAASAAADIDNGDGRAEPVATARLTAAERLAGLRVRAPKARKRPEGARSTRRAEPAWVGRLSLLRSPTFDAERGTGRVLPAQQQVCYVVLAGLSRRHRGAVIEMRQRTAMATGWSKPKPLRLAADQVPALPDAVDRELCALLLGASRVGEVEPTGLGRGGERAHATYRLLPGSRRAMLKRLIGTERCLVDATDDGVGGVALTWSDEPWVLWMVGRFENGGEDDAPAEFGADSPAQPQHGLSVRVELRRGDAVMSVDAPSVICGGEDGLLIHGREASPFDDRDAWRWIAQFRDVELGDGQGKRLWVPQDDVSRFLDRLYMLPQLPEIDLPEDIGRREVSVRPVPHLELFSPGTAEAGEVLPASSKHQLAGRVWFAYGDRRVSPMQSGRFVPAKPEEPAADAGPDGDGDGETILAEPTETDATNAADTDATAEASRSALVRRNLQAERDAATHLAPLGVRQAAADGEGNTLVLPSKRLGHIVGRLIGLGWSISADRRVIRAAGPASLSIRSGIDWFELRGSIGYELADGTRTEITLPQILAAARSGQTLIELGDGSQALLPEEWLAEHGLLTAMGELEGDHLRFRTSQAAMLDALLDEKELTDFDQQFARVRGRLAEFAGIEPIDAPAEFHGQLRGYQRHGLGWMRFLRWFGVGGVLADDMGLGKTIQVLANLQGRRAGMPAGGVWEAEPITDEPTLIVAPRSVVFNWVDEAEKFTPGLKVVAYAGTDRGQVLKDIEGYDVIVTSYGLLRRDIDQLRETVFDYVVLDEAQAIKNPASQSAKAARLLRSRHRLALTGTPIENHLGDLWSIFEFLNPGMLGSNSRFGDLVRGVGAGQTAMSERSITQPAATNGDTPPPTATPTAADAAQADAAADPELEADDPVAPERQADPTLQQVAAVLRPFILRRTKGQVLKDLPPKTEQTLVCEMEPAQRKVYDDLAAFYRGKLIGQLDAANVGKTGGLGSASFMVLEALLRLRQAACHPGLIDEARADEPSAKLDVLVDRVVDIIEEGSKALIFSQFVKMLHLVRRRLDERKIGYCYLDGQTRDRRGEVERFQNDPHHDNPLFLISLKTGGLGLNLTAAEYAFILDPWWNPAVEAQAIDRAHRIGQTKPVFAYRLICEDTVEQRIAQLQRQKKDLAEAIIGGEQSVMRSLTRQDLEALLA